MKTLLRFSILLAAAVLAFAAPADGTWNVQGSIPSAPQQLVLTVSGTTLTGTIDGAAISNGTAQNTTIHFRATRSGVAYLYKATVVNGQLELIEEQTNGQTRQFTYAHPAN